MQWALKKNTCTSAPEIQHEIYKVQHAKTVICITFALLPEYLSFSPYLFRLFLA